MSWPAINDEEQLSGRPLCVMMCAWPGARGMWCVLSGSRGLQWAHQPLKLILGLQLYSLYSFIDLFCIGTPRLPSSCLGAFSTRWPGLRHNQQLAQRYHQQLNCFTWKPHKQRNVVNGEMTSSQCLLPVNSQTTLLHTTTHRWLVP